MNRDRRSSSNDPTDERSSDQSTQTASGLSGSQADASSRPPRGAGPSGDAVGSGAALETPRRYEQPLEDDDDPVMPADDPTLNTKI